MCTYSPTEYIFRHSTIQESTLTSSLNARSKKDKIGGDKQVACQMIYFFPKVLLGIVGAGLINDSDASARRRYHHSLFALLAAGIRGVQSV